MAINEERSYTEYNVEVPTTDFPIGFDILDDGIDVVAVTLNGVDPTTLGYTVIQVNNTTYRFAPAVPSGVVRLTRITDIDQMAHVFTEGAIFISENMDGNFKQLRHAQQEVRDGFNKLSQDTYAIIDTLEAVGQAAQDAAGAAQEAAQTANDAAQEVTNKVDRREGAALPYDEAVEYFDGAVTYKDNELQQLKDDQWKPTKDTDVIKTVESIADLIAINNPKNHQTVFSKARNSGTGKGGGSFVFHAGSTKNDGGMFFATDKGSWHRVILEVWHNVQWWGAVGDGVTDAIQAVRMAVEAHGNVENWNGGSNPTNNSFCTLYFPPSEGSYVVSDTIYILPYMRIKGDSSKGGSLEWVNDKYRSCIEARFPDAINYKFVISTINRMRATGELCAWDIMPAGASYDTGFVTGCFGSCVEDIVIQTLNKDNRVYGAIKMQNSPECSVERCFIRGFFDVGVAACGAWSSRFDFSSDTYKCGFVGYGDMNNTTIRGYHHGKKGNALLPLPQQVTPLMSYDNTSGLPFDESTKRFGVYLQYAYGFVLDALINEYHDVGLFVTQSQGSVNSLYSEGNDISVAAVASAFRIGSLTGVGNNSAFALGTGANIHLDAMSPDHYKANFVLSASEYNAELHVPKILNVPYNRSISVDRSAVYLNGTTGNDANSGLRDINAVKTLSQALTNLSNIDNSAFFRGSNKYVKKSKTLIICDSSNYTLNSWLTLTDMDLTVIRLTPSLTPTITVSNYNFILDDTRIIMDGINLKRTYDDNYQGSQGFFICGGDCSITTKNSNIDLDYHLVTVNPTVLADVTLKILGGAGAMTDYAKYFSTASKNVSANIIVRLNNTGYDLNASADNGVTAPVEAHIVKSVSAVL